VVVVKPAPWFVVLRWAASPARRARLTGIEIFPNGPGFSGVRAPLTRHPKDGQRYPLIDPDTGEIATGPGSPFASRCALFVPDNPPAPEPQPLRIPVGRTGHRELVTEVVRFTPLR
jgi:hypothetical protein